MPDRENVVRVAVVQIQSHPAAYISFVGQRRVRRKEWYFKRGKLGQHGFSIGTLQETCLERYVEWHSARLDSILRFLIQLDPAPDLIVFPEYCIPWQCLRQLHAWLADTTTSLFAGTHAIQSLPRAIHQYRAVGLDDKRARKLARKQATAALPLLAPTGARLIPKRTLSPQEQTDVSDLHIKTPTFIPLRLESAHFTTAVLPLICSDALHAHRVKGAY